MELPSEFQFKTIVSEGPYYAYQTKAGFVVKHKGGCTHFTKTEVKHALKSGTWIIVEPKLIAIKPMPTIEPLEDLINKPSHYHKNEIDVHGYLEKHFPKEPNVTVAEGFYMGNVIKYVSRHKEKGGLQDLEKAQFNLNKLKELWVKSHE